MLVTAWKTAVDYLPPKFSVDHSADQYGMQANVNPPQYAETSDGLTRGLTPPAAEELYHPIQEPFLVPPKYRRMYNFSDGHGKYLYTKDPLWVEARERYWDDLQTASQVHRANYHHIRTKYRKQWHDANRYNLDEYLTTMNRVKHMEVVRREAEEETRQEQLQDDLARIDAISLLQQKRRNLRVDKFWKVNVWTHERYGSHSSSLPPPSCPSSSPPLCTSGLRPSILLPPRSPLPHHLFLLQKNNNKETPKYPPFPPGPGLDPLSSSPSPLPAPCAAEPPPPRPAPPRPAPVPSPRRPFVTSPTLLHLLGQGPCVFPPPFFQLRPLKKHQHQTHHQDERRAAVPHEA